MTHFCTYVFTTDRPSQDDLERMLWPWSIYNLESADRRRFDYFEVGGRFRFALDPQPSDADPDPLCLRTQKQKRALAIDALRERAVARAATTYDEIHEILAGRPLPDIAELTRLHGERGWSDHFHADPSVQAVRKSGVHLDPWTLAALAAPRETVLSRAADRAILPHAIVSDRRWHEFEEMCFDEDQVKADAWRDLFARVFDAAGQDDWLTVVDCHF